MIYNTKVTCLKNIGNDSLLAGVKNNLALIQLMA